MNNKLKNIKKELGSFFSSELNKTDYFTIIYGSYAYGADRAESDLDFVTYASEFNEKNMENTMKFIFDLYKRYDIALDYEVPHEKKVLVKYKLLEDGIKGRGFEKRGDKLFVPPVVKSKEFLESNEIIMRLSLNSITSENIFVSGNMDYYLSKRSEALENLVAFIFSINDITSVNIDEFVQYLIGTQERNGEMYLGYKDKGPVREYLKNVFKAEFEHFFEQNIFGKSDNRYYLKNNYWFDSIIQS
ncbi:nucleotidyltransferase domain-containing protein [Candidatus Woesearchaeota archaeon]|nr:hypothetical protein [uncultured archaeon]MBS3108144.1 nucleotidyltransferase domain-containing protein [Candidatus Woesearchaeota archaeon]